MLSYGIICAKILAVCCILHWEYSLINPINIVHQITLNFLRPLSLSLAVCHFGIVVPLKAASVESSIIAERHIVSNPKEVQVIEHMWIPVADGVRLSAKIWMPVDAYENPVPAILEYLPYRKREGTRKRDQQNHIPIAEAGYACIRVDIRGSGESEGVYTDEYTDEELQDGYAVIAWLAEQPWCSGEVGMMGISWGGMNAMQIAAMRPPALKAIVTLGATDDRYATDVHYLGGALLKDNISWSGAMFGFNALPPDPEIVGDAWYDMWQARMEANRPWALDWIRHQRRDEFWQRGSISDDYSQVECAVYAISGWGDNYSESIPRLLAGLRSPRKGLIGPWAHQYPHHGKPGPAIGFLQETLRWWDYWLKGIDNGIMDEPMYRVWMMGGQLAKDLGQPRPGRWVAEATWPSPRIETKRYYLNVDGLLAETNGEVTPLTIASSQSTGMTQGLLVHGGANAAYPKDQAEDDTESLVFLSQPLEENVEIMGAAVVQLTLSSDQPIALVAVRLNDVSPDGNSTRVQQGVLNLNRSKDMSETILLVPGETYTVRVEIDDVAQTFPKGHRMAVSISTSNFPLVWPSPKPVTLTIQSGLSFLELPERPFDPTDAQLADFEKPIWGEGEQKETIKKGPGFIYETYTDEKTGRVVSRTVYNYGLGTYPATGIISGYPSEILHSVDPADPLSAEYTSNDVAIWKKGDIDIKVQSRHRLTADLTDFFFEAELEAFNHGVSVFQRSWKETIPRDGI